LRKAEGGRAGGTLDAIFLPPKVLFTSFTVLLFGFPRVDLGSGEGDTGGSLVSAKTTIEKSNSARCLSTFRWANTL